MARVEKKVYLNKYLFLFMVVLLIVISLLIIEKPFSDKSENIRGTIGADIGDTITDLKFKSFNDKEVKFSDYKGKALIINSWSGWCVFCMDEMYELQKFRDENRDKLEVLFVHRTATESVDAAKKYLANFPIDKQIAITNVVIDPNDDFYNMFFGYGMPVMLFVDDFGVIKDKKVGYMDYEEISKRAEKIASGFMQAMQILNNEIKISNGIKYLVDPEKLVSSGPPKDGIPSIDNPKFISPKEADKWLEDNDYGIGVDYNVIPKFYPYNIMARHEIVNDFFRGKAVLITYCPLCSTGIAFERNVSGENLEFGVSGKLYNSNLVMYDRKTDSYWVQILGKAIIGNLTGIELNKIQADIVTYGGWKKLNPDTLVLSKDTGFPFVYSEDLYSSNNYDYYKSPDVLYPLENEDNRLSPKEIVFGLQIDKKFKAYTFDDIKNKRVINDYFSNKNIAVFYDDESGAVRFFLAELSGKNLDFEIRYGKIFDKETGYEWDINGNALSGELKGDKLEGLITVYGFWFNWAAFHPNTEIYSTN